MTKVTSEHLPDSEPAATNGYTISQHHVPPVEAPESMGNAALTPQDRQAEAHQFVAEHPQQALDMYLVLANALDGAGMIPPTPPAEAPRLIPDGRENGHSPEAAISDLRQHLMGYGMEVVMTSEPFLAKLRSAL